MERTKNKKRKPNLILCADFHLREGNPVCRTDDHWSAQWKKVDFIRELQTKHDCPVLHAGDLFDHWKPSPYLLSETIQHLPDNFWTIYGNHDLPQHSLELAHKCGVNTLESAGSLRLIPECHWEKIPKNNSFAISCPIDSIKLGRHAHGYSILVWHVMTYQGKEPWPGCTDPLASKLLRKYPQYDLILTGHNHQSFVEEYEGRLLVNPGSLTRRKADQIDHRPCVYLWYAEDNTVEAIYLPITQNVVTRDHIVYKEQRDERIDAFVSRLDHEWKVAMSIEQSLEQYYQVNPIRKSVMDIVQKAMDPLIKT